MAVLSCLKNIRKLNTLSSGIALLKNASKTKAVNYIPIRMSHGHEFPLKASLYSFYKSKDLMIFYLMLGILPLAAIVTYVNIFIGPAELALIPEGYEPKHWEYYRHPITRFIAKNFVVSPQERYERNLHNVLLRSEFSQISELQKEIRHKMSERLDYQAWYLQPPPTKYHRRVKEVVDDYVEGIHNNQRVPIIKP